MSLAAASVHLMVSEICRFTTFMTHRDDDVLLQALVEHLQLVGPRTEGGTLIAEFDMAGDGHRATESLLARSHVRSARWSGLVGEGLP